MFYEGDYTDPNYFYLHDRLGSVRQVYLWFYGMFVEGGFQAFLLSRAAPKPKSKSIAGSGIIYWPLRKMVSPKSS